MFIFSGPPPPSGIVLCSLLQCTSLCVCTHACVCIHPCACVQPCLCVCTHACVCSHACVCTHSCVCAPIPVSVHSCLCVPTHACACVHPCLCVCSHACSQKAPYLICVYLSLKDPTGALCRQVCTCGGRRGYLGGVNRGRADLVRLWL